MINSNAILEINKKNLLYNYKILSKLANKSITAATIKANAYGLGDIQILNILKKNGCNHFFLATTEEALRIRNNDKKINLYVLNGLEKNDLNIFNKYNLIPILNSKEELETYIQSKYYKTNFKIGIHIDTGLNRLGVELSYLKKKILKEINLEILISHLASSDEIKNQYNKIQNLNFKNAFNYFKSIKYKSLSASHGAVNNKDFHYDMIRPGISLYGGYNRKFNNKIKIKIKHVINLKGKILQIKDVNKNEYIGYNQTYKTYKKIKIAIIGIGYADGISRLLSNNGKLYYKDFSYNIIGRISMDSITIDISKSSQKIKTGDYMYLINKDNNIEKMAKKYGTISNEILTSISKRVKREYI